MNRCEFLCTWGFCCFFLNPYGWFVYQLLQQPVLSLLLFGMVGQLILRFDALIMHPRQETSLCLPEKQHLSFFSPFVAQTNAGDVVDPPGWYGQLFYRDEVHVCKSTFNLLSPRKQGWQAAPPPWARIIGFNSREGLVKCWSSGNIFLKPFGLCRVHRKHLKRGSKAWMMVGAITFKQTNQICYCVTLATAPWLAALHCWV